MQRTLRATADGWRYLVSVAQGIRHSPTWPTIRLLFPSETLWRMGPRKATDWALRHLTAANAQPVAIKPSRVDPCADILLRESDWHEGLRPLLVTRAQSVSVHTSNGQLSGLSIERLPGALYQKNRGDWIRTSDLGVMSP